MQYPHMGMIYIDNPYMDISERIARRLTHWMATSPDMDTLKKVAARSKTSYGTVQRMRAGNNNITIANLEAVAKAFGHSLAELTDADDSPTADQTRAEYATLHQIERDLVTWYRHTSPEARKMLQLIMQANPAPGPKDAPTAAQDGASHILDNHEKARKKLYRTAQALVKKTPTRKTQEKP